MYEGKRKLVLAINFMNSILTHSSFCDNSMDILLHGRRKKVHRQQEASSIKIAGEFLSKKIYENNNIFLNIDDLYSA